MDFVSGGDVLQCLADKRSLSEEHSRWWFQQLIFGLDYVHKVCILLSSVWVCLLHAQIQGNSMLDVHVLPRE